MTAPISVQLYSLRKEAARDFPAVLERLGRIGYVGVEFAGLHDQAPDVVRRHLDAAGLRTSSAHVQLSLGDDAERTLDEQATLGNDTLIVAFLPPERFETLDAVRSSADALNEANEIVRARGMRLGYHNHWWEFATRIDGRTAHAHLFEHLADDVFAEVDVYWAKFGGVDPAKTVADLGRRARYLHVKDGPADDPASPMTAVGEGVIEIPEVLGANAAVEWHVVELDRCATDMFEAIERSHHYLVDGHFSLGRA